MEAAFFVTVEVQDARRGRGRVKGSWCHGQRVRATVQGGGNDGQVHSLSIVKSNTEAGERRMRVLTRTSGTAWIVVVLFVITANVHDAEKGAAGESFRGN